MAQTVKNLSAMQEVRVWFLGFEDPLEKEMATHSSILAWRISWPKESGRLQYTGQQRIGHNWATNTFTFQHRHHFVDSLSHWNTFSYTSLFSSLSGKSSVMYCPSCTVYSKSSSIVWKRYKEFFVWGVCVSPVSRWDSLSQFILSCHIFLAPKNIQV